MATPSVISLLLHNLFNASIPAEHIPSDSYEWDPEATLPYSLAPPYLQRNRSTAARPPDDDTEEVEDSTGEEAGLLGSDARMDQLDILVDPERGCWVERITSQPLGGEDGRLSFTVVG